MGLPSTIRETIRKEESFVTYKKPQLSGIPAISAIQTSGSNAKTTSMLEAGQQFLRTQPAYEADE
jgi:hypothetical protein